MTEFQATLISDRPDADGQAWIYRTYPAKVLVPRRTRKLIKQKKNIHLLCGENGTLLNKSEKNFPNKIPDTLLNYF